MAPATNGKTACSLRVMAPGPLWNRVRQEARRSRSNSHRPPLGLPCRRQHGVEAHSLGSKCPLLLCSPKHSICCSSMGNSIGACFPGTRSSYFLCFLSHSSPCLPAPSRNLFKPVPLLLEELREITVGTWEPDEASLEGLTTPPGLSKPPCPTLVSSICFL